MSKYTVAFQQLHESYTSNSYQFPVNEYSVRNIKLRVAYILPGIVSLYSTPMMHVLCVGWSELYIHQSAQQSSMAYKKPDQYN